MAKHQIDEIKIIVADSNRQLRTSLKGVLHQHGFRGIVDTPTLEGLEDEIRVINPDLILCDYDLVGENESGGVCQLISRMRHNKLGQNPFAAVIMFIEEANEEVVKAASLAGLDDIQVKPVVAQSIIDRVTYLIKQRKPFVVTTDYVGPDRRKSNRPGTMEIPIVEVPNTLASKAIGKYDPREVQRQIETTLWNINAQKIERHIYQVAYLVERIIPAYNEGAINKETLAMVTRLVHVSKDVVSRLTESDYGHITDLASTLANIARSLWESGTLPKRKDLNLLPELSAALSAAIKVQDQSASIVQKISSSVQEKY